MPASHAARVRAVGVLAIAAVLLSACGSSTSPGEPTWTPKPSFSGEGYQPGERQPVQPHPSANPAPASPSPGTSKGDDPAIVATKLRAPTGILILPDNSALVGERTTGRILRVQPVPKQPVQTVRIIAGISTTGGGGLLDLAISPNYGEDNLIFA